MADQPKAAPGRLSWRDECRSTSPYRWRVPPYGFLDHLEVHFTDPIPNMDASGAFEVEVRISMNGQTIHADRVVACAREVLIAP